MSHLRAVRQAESLAALVRLKEDLGGWLIKRRADDPRGQYATQLARLEAEITGSIEALLETVTAASGIVGNGAFFADASANDQRIIWVRNAWDYFRQKFDQRDDDSVKSLLHAADEVVWSCYKPFFSPGKAIPPAPLSCVDASYVPNSLRPDTAPHQLGRTRDIEDSVLGGYLKTLPIPILRLPPNIAGSPWSLALIGHEIGHFIQRLIVSDPDFFDWITDRIESAVREAGGGPGDIMDWRRCADEIFADLYFVLTMGPWALWALAPWVLGSDDFMVSRQKAYPAPLVRLRMLAAFAEALGLAGAGGLRQELLGPYAGVPGAAKPNSPQTELDLRIADKIAGLATATLPDAATTLAQRMRFRADDFATGDRVDRWASALAGGAPVADEHKLRSARLMTAASVKACHEAAAMCDDGACDARLALLRQTASARIAACFEEGKRAAPAETRMHAAPGLARLVLDATTEMLFR
jgi:hypothetical protein